MTREETYIMSHYTEIAEAKQRDVRRMQAEIVQGALRGAMVAVVMWLKPKPLSGEAQSSEMT